MAFGQILILQKAWRLITYPRHASFPTVKPDAEYMRINEEKNNRR